MESVAGYYPSLIPLTESATSVPPRCHIFLQRSDATAGFSSWSAVGDMRRLYNLPRYYFHHFIPSNAIFTVTNRGPKKYSWGQSPEKFRPFYCITAVRTHGCCVRLGGSASKNTGVRYTVGNSRLTNVAPSPMYRAGGPSARRRRVNACGGARPGGRWCAGRLAVAQPLLPRTAPPHSAPCRCTPAGCSLGPAAPRTACASDGAGLAANCAACSPATTAAAVVFRRCRQEICSVSSSICKFAPLYIAIIQLKWLGRKIPRNLEFILLKHGHI